MSLTQYEKDRLQYLRYYEKYPPNKGGLDDNERVELFRLTEKAKLGLGRRERARKFFVVDDKP